MLPRFLLPRFFLSSFFSDMLPDFLRNLHSNSFEISPALLSAVRSATPRLPALSDSCSWEQCDPTSAACLWLPLYFLTVCGSLWHVKALRECRVFVLDRSGPSISVHCTIQYWVLYSVVTSWKLCENVDLFYFVLDCAITPNTVNSYPCFLQCRGSAAKFLRCGSVFIENWT